MLPFPSAQQVLMYPKTPGYFSDLSSSLCCKSYCFFLKLLVVFPIPFSLLHFTPPKVLRLYCNLTFRCVRYFGGSSRCIMQCPFTKAECIKTNCALWVTNINKDPNTPNSCAFKFIAIKLSDIYQVSGN